MRLPLLRVRRGPRGRLPRRPRTGDDPSPACLRGLRSTLHHLRAGRGGAHCLVLKRDGSRERFELGKLGRPGLREGLQEPADLPATQILRIASDIEEAVRARGQREVESQEVGIELLNALRELDPVAYMRFASVYKDFQDPADFERELEDLGSLRKTTPPETPLHRHSDLAGRAGRESRCAGGGWTGPEAVDRARRGGGGWAGRREP